VNSHSRGNQLSTLDTFQQLSLPGLRILDLSFNELQVVLLQICVVDIRSMIDWFMFVQ
jgi:hypothetical protein